MTAGPEHRSEHHHRQFGPDRTELEPRYAAPRECPVCSERLQVTRLGCPHCGTGLTGEFAACAFCGLDTADREMLRVFLGSRGNMRELERHLGVSYPTARSRFDDLLGRLGYTAGGADEAPAAPAGAADAVDPRLDTLRALADGSLDVDAARRRLSPDSS
jgi:hypothetical protein